MIYVFDTCSLSQLKHFYPTVFKTLWEELDNLFQQGKLISTKEVFREMQNGSPSLALHVDPWIKQRKSLFTTPDNNELEFVAEIFKIPHFHALIGEKQRLEGKPVADPFLIACAKVRNGTVVTQEVHKPNSPKIPNICQHFNIPCIDLEDFMQKQGWYF